MSHSLQNALKCIEQNSYYCGSDCDTMVNNVFVYGPDGKVFCGNQLSGELSGRWFDSSFFRSSEGKDGGI